MYIIHISIFKYYIIKNSSIIITRVSFKIYGLDRRMELVPTRNYIIFKCLRMNFFKDSIHFL